MKNIKLGVFMMIALMVMGSGCTSHKQAYEGSEYSRVQNCKLNFGPNDPQLEYCIERARIPYEDIEEELDSDVSDGKRGRAGSH